MAERARVPITPGGYEALLAELKHIREVERPKNVADIERAREHGDLSENAEYHAAKERQSFLQGRLQELEYKIARAEVIDPKTLGGERVVFGATVTIMDLENEEESVYQIVGDDESDVDSGKISISSPLARSMIGKEVAEEFLVRTPKGTKRYEVAEVEFK